MRAASLTLVIWFYFISKDEIRSTNDIRYLTIFTQLRLVLDPEKQTQYG
jgi:hypothetical protein